MSKMIKSSGNITLSANDTVFVETNLTVAGDFKVTGTVDTVNTTNTNIIDRVVTLNKGETGSGVSAPDPLSGITVDRGSATDVSIRWNEPLLRWELVDETGTSALITTGGPYLTKVEDDTDPKLGGNLDLMFHDVYGTGNIDITGTIDATGTITGGNVQTAGNLTIGAGTADQLDIYADAVGSGGTGIWYTNTASETAELISKKKAIVYSIIF